MSVTAWNPDDSTEVLVEWGDTILEHLDADGAEALAEQLRECAALARQNAKRQVQP